MKHNYESEKKFFDNCLELLIRKNNDYSSQSDKWNCFRSSEKFGVPGWMGAFIRLGDKINRLVELVNGEAKIEESIDDNLMDVANYANIIFQLRNEKK